MGTKSVFQATQTITLNWNIDDYTPKEHIEALKESGFARAHEMINEGFREGEMSDNIRMLDTDPEDGIPYTGYWSVDHAEDR
jgi:hypothetical protein